MSANANSAPVVLPHVEIYTDGGCEPNPGPGGYGAVLDYEYHLFYPKCQTVYHVEDARRFVEQPPSLF